MIGREQGGGDEPRPTGQWDTRDDRKKRGDRHPKVRDGVLLCAGAKVLGNVEIGRDAKVGAGSVVLHDVPPRATVAGVPARIVGWSSGSVPALEMDQSLPDYEI